MSDNDSPETGSNVFPFPRIGFTLTPTNTPSPAPTPAPAPAPNPATTTTQRTGRRSPLDALNALPDPGLTAPLVPYTAPTTPAPAPGLVPDTFRSEPAPDMVGPRLGALSLAAILAVAVAAMRGTATFLQDRRQRRLDRAEEAAPIRQARLKHQLAMQQAGYDRQLSGAKHSAAMQGLGEKAAQQRAKTSSKVPSSSAFGSKSLSGRTSTGSGSGSGSGRGSGTGRGKSSGTGGSSSSGSGASRNGSSGLKNGRGGAQGPKTKKNSPLFGGGSSSGNSRTGGAGGKGTGGGRGLNRPGHVVDPKKQKGPKGPHRASQGAGTILKKNGKGGGLGPGGKQTNSAGNGSGSNGPGGRTTLPEALKKTTQKAAARRLKRRRKNLGNPVLWGAAKSGGKNKQLRNGTGTGTGKGNVNANANGKNTSKGNGQKNGQTGGSGKPVNLNKPQTPGRTTLNQALRKAALKAARKRLKQRRRNPATPPIWSAGGNSNQRPSSGGPGTPQSQGGTANRKQRGPRQSTGRWAKARAYARKKATTRGRFPGGGTSTAGAAGSAGAAGATPGPGQQHGPRQRRSPFQNAGQAAANAAPQYTVTRADHPGAQAKTWNPAGITQGTPALPATGPAALGAAPTTNPPRPGTTRPRSPIPMPKTSQQPTAMVAKAHKDAARTAQAVVGRQMDAQHETEITLDDACDSADELTQDAFAAHDESSRLAAKARKLRDTWILFADDLATNHNLIGPLFTAAAIRFAESMDLVARMADEMQASSLEAAEKAETAGNELNNAYRPYNTATADAGLSTPSAPIHNEA